MTTNYSAHYVTVLYLSSLTYTSSIFRKRHLENPQFPFVHSWSDGASRRRQCYGL